MLADIRKDSIELQQKIAVAIKCHLYIDSLLVYLYENPTHLSLTPKFDKYNLNALRRLDVIMEDRTALLLKNSGGIRLIRQGKVTEKLLEYWKQQSLVQTSLERYLIYRNHAREFSEQLFASAENYLSSRKLITIAVPAYRVIRTDPALWDQYMNIVTRCGVVLPTMIGDLNNTLTAGEELKQEIHRSYY